MAASRSPGDPDDVQVLAEALRPVLRRLLRSLRRESRDLGASPLQSLLLVAIVEQPGIGVGELARQENLRGPTISGHIKTLQSAGLVARTPPDPDDRRRVGLVATPKGHEVIAAMRRRRTDWLAQRLAGLSPEARLAIRAALEPLSEIGR
ncbi:MAG: MarR family winged helix-turn-helix transcriptional regulator [Phreatobacter sp.]